MAKADLSGVTEQSKASVHRRADAKALIEGKRWRGAMYLAGYSVECMLKAQLMRKYDCETLQELEDELISRGLLPVKQTVYTHQLLTLLQLTGGADRMRQNKVLWSRFMRVNDWIPAWRYTADLADKKDAEDFLSAIDQVLRWVRNNV